MLLVQTYLDKSRIHGLGVFAAEPIRKDAKIWRFVFGFDRYYSRKKLAKLPKPARDFIKLHGYQWKNEILLSMDHDTFMNHSDEPNTYYKDGYVLARCNIRKGEEITNDYRAFEASFCASFLKNGHDAKTLSNGNGTRPRQTASPRTSLNGAGRHADASAAHTPKASR
jgi:SET domain-containing protein